MDDSLKRLFAREEVELTFEVVDLNHTTFKSKNIIRIKSLARNRFFFISYFWTGSEDDPFPELLCHHDQWGHPVHRIHGPIIKEGNNRICIIDLGRSFEQGEEETVTIHRDFFDRVGSFQRFLGFNAYAETKKITLTVLLPNSYAGQVVFRERMLDSNKEISNKKLAPCDQLSNSNNKCYQYVSESIIVNRGYRITWD